MNAVGKGLDFTLTRSQRFHTLAAGWWLPIFVFCGFLIVLVPIGIQYPTAGVVFGILIFFLFRYLVFGLLNLLRDGRTHVEIEDRGIGFGRETADWWIFTDGIKQIRKNRWGTTSICHHNGTCVDVPTTLLSSDDYRKLEAGMKKYHDFGRCRKEPAESPTRGSSQ